MPIFRWIIDSKQYDKQRLDRPTAQEVRNYFNGFKLNRIEEKAMHFKDEIADLEQVYKSTLKEAEKEVEWTLPLLVSDMEDFITLYKHKVAIREKLEILLAKNGRESSEKDGIHD